MKIIKKGDLTRVDTTRHFNCKHCGCLFEANRSEYKTQSDFRNGHFYVHQCPTCGQDVIAYPEEEAAYR